MNSMVYLGGTDYGDKRRIETDLIRRQTDLIPRQKDLIPRQTLDEEIDVDDFETKTNRQADRQTGGPFNSKDSSNSGREGSLGVSAVQILPRRLRTANVEERSQPHSRYVPARARAAGRACGHTCVRLCVHAVNHAGGALSHSLQSALVQFEFYQSFLPLVPFPIHSGTKRDSASYRVSQTSIHSLFDCDGILSIADHNSSGIGAVVVMYILTIR